MKSIVVIIILFLSGCVFLHSKNRTELVNETGSDVEVRIYYDKIFLDSVYENRSNVMFSYLREYAVKPNRFLILLDTTALVATYKVSKDTSLMIFEDSGNRPDFRTFVKVEVKSNKGTTMYSVNTMLSIITKKEAGLWQWHVK